MAGISMVGLLVRNRGAGPKMSFGELLARRRAWFRRLDEIRDEVDVQRHRQWSYRRHFHWDPQDLCAVAGSARMWEREPGEPMFAVVRVGVGKVKLAMTLEKPDIAPAADLEPATGHALRKFLNAQEYVDDVPKVVWLQRFPGLSFVGDLPQARGLARAVICQLAAFHSPADAQIIVVTSSPQQWGWVKWLPRVQHERVRDGCGERRMVFSSPGDLEAFLDQEIEEVRPAWSPPSSGVSAGLQAVLPLRAIVDDGVGSAEDWAGLTGATGYAGTCFIRLAAQVPARPSTAAPGAGRHWVGFAPETTYRIHGGVLRKQVPGDPRQRARRPSTRDQPPLMSLTTRSTRPPIRSAWSTPNASRGAWRATGRPGRPVSRSRPPPPSSERCWTCWGFATRGIWTPTGCGHPPALRGRRGCGFRSGFTATPARSPS
jgi:S-DNA-T family DNA segregation ATPase FtsK/SpoIIIE